jgi:hypothetical protein
MVTLRSLGSMSMLFSTNKCLIFEDIIKSRRKMITQFQTHHDRSKPACMCTSLVLVKSDPFLTPAWWRGPLIDVLACPRLRRRRRLEKQKQQQSPVIMILHPSHNDPPRNKNNADDLPRFLSPALACLLRSTGIFQL